MVRDGLAVAGAWSVIEGTDCGIYAVGTVPVWRRRGLATGLMHGILGDAYRRGAPDSDIAVDPDGLAALQVAGVRAGGPLRGVGTGVTAGRPERHAPWRAVSAWKAISWSKR